MASKLSQSTLTSKSRPLCSSPLLNRRKDFHTNPSSSLAKGSSDADRCKFLYDKALRFARHQNYKGARRAFQTCISVIPDFSKAWVSWAQVNPPTQKKMEDVALDKHFETSPNGHSAMEKRTVLQGEEDSIERCRKILQKGLSLNPTDAKILQAWGLLELQRGNVLAAVILLDRCVQYEPSCGPVLQWRAVQIARRSVSNRIRRTIADPLSQVVEVNGVHQSDHGAPSALTT